MTHLPEGSCATFLVSPHCDVICDLSLNRRTATRNLFVKWSTLIVIFKKLATLFDLKTYFDVANIIVSYKIFEKPLGLPI